MRAIFISYRREDAEGQAGRLFDDLSHHFGEDTVFMDVAGIEPGRDFRRVIDEHVASCGVLLAMIGKSWIDAKDDAGRRRLEDPMDFVRLETASALKRDIPVVPVLVQGAHIPRAEQLPGDLAELAYRNGVELTHARWDSDVQVLIKALSPYVESLQKNGGSAQNSAPAEKASTTRATVTASLRGAPVDTAPTPTEHAAKKSLRTMSAVSVAAIALGFGGYRVYQNTAEKAKAAALERLAQESAREKAEADRIAAEKAKAEEAEKIARDKANQQADADRIAADKAKLDAERLALERTQRQAEADRIAAQKAKEEAERIAQENARRQAEADRIAAEKAKAEADRLAAAKAKAAEMERIALARAKQLRARWPYYRFPPPNGGLAVFTIMPDGNPACASYDAASCLWGLTFDQIDFKRLRPLVCGEAHRARWGVTGYEDPRHWCSLARRVRANPS